MHQQAVALKDDVATVEQMYAVVNRKYQIVETRMPDLPSAVGAMTRLQSMLNEAMTNSSGFVEFYEQDALN